MSDPLIIYIFTAPAICAGAFFCLGAVLGSFMSALVYRLPRRLNWVSARSRCPSCGHVLGVLDLVPILSWLFLRGRCRHCHAVIPARYPLIELSFATLCAALGYFLAL